MTNDAMKIRIKSKITIKNGPVSFTPLAPNLNRNLNPP